MSEPADHPLARIQARLTDGRLPDDEPVKTYTFYAREEYRCAGCDERLHPAHLEREVEMADGRRLHLHISCHGLWMADRRLRARHGVRHTTAVSQDADGPRCPACGSRVVTALGSVVAGKGAFRVAHRCERCGRDFMHVRPD